MWALLPVVATERLGQGSGGYGLLLAALGVGAIAGALLLPRLNAALSINQAVAAASVVYAAAMVALVAVRNVWVGAAVLIPAGMAWIAVLSNVNAGLQLFLPGWVRGRGLSVYQMVVFGAQGAGAVLFGLVANQVGVTWTFVAVAALLVAGAASIRIWPFIDVSAMDRARSAHWPEPRLAPGVEPSDSAVVVSVTSTIDEGVEREFVAAMEAVRGGRLRTGATQWGLFRDAESPRRFVELFEVPSWDEHLRQHRERLTATDREIEERAKRLSNPPPETRHFLAVDLD